MKNAVDPDPMICDPRSLNPPLFGPLIPDPIYLVTTLLSLLLLRPSKVYMSYMYVKAT